MPVGGSSDGWIQAVPSRNWRALRCVPAGKLARSQAVVSQKRQSINRQIIPPTLFKGDCRCTMVNIAHQNK